MSDSAWTIQVPKTNWNDSGKDMRSRLQTWNWRWSPPVGKDRLLLDFTAVSFMEPWALAMFAAYGLEVRAHLGLPVEALLDDSNACNHYLKMMGLDEVLRTGKSSDRWAEDQRNTGLHIIRNHEDVTRFVRSATRIGPGPDDETMDALKYGMTETGRNVVQHAASQAGGVAIAQFFPDKRSIQIVMC